MYSRLAKEKKELVRETTTEITQISVCTDHENGGQVLRATWKKAFMAYADNEGPNQPLHLRLDSTRYGTI